MPSVYQKSGLQFAYPENWELIEGENDEALVEVMLRSPGAAFWSLTVFPGLRDTQALLAEVVQAMQAEYPDLEREPVDSLVGGQSLAGVELRFVCLDFTNTAQVHVYHHDGDTHLLLRQAEDREWKVMEPVFGAMTLSLQSDTPLAD